MFIDFQCGPSHSMLAALAGLCSATGDAPGGGGGSPPSGLGAGASFTQEQWDALEAKFGSMVNAAITSRDKRFEKQLGDRFDQLIQKFDAKPPPPVTEEPSGKVKEKDVALQTIQRQLEEMRLRAEAADQLARVERSKNRDNERRRLLAEGLGAIGVTDPVRVQHAIAWLDLGGRVAYEDDETERLVWRDGSGNAIDFAVGLRGWSRTEDAKHFIAPSGARGAGSAPSRGAGPNGQLTEAQILARLDDAIRNQI